MPSTTTLFITSALTLTQIVTLTTGLPQVDILGPIEGLSDCAQEIIFEGLADSICNPANFPCICDELTRLNIGFLVDGTCTLEETAQYDDFVRTLCSTIRPVAPSVPSVPSIPQNISNTTSTPALPPIPLFTGTGLPTNGTNGTVGPVGPFPNVTDAATVLPPPAVTSVIVIPTTDAQGNPTLLTTAVAPVAPPTAAAPGEPEFTGAAARGVEVPEFGGVRMGFVAGGVGLFALLFAGM